MRFTRLYVGGGTPTYFSTAELRRLVASLRANLGVTPAGAGGCIECSPETLDAAKVAYLREAGFRRISLGVQSFDEGELSQVNRRFDFARNAEAVALVGRAGFDEFNVDLIYGLPGQTRASWRESLARATDTAATSLFLYPLYVRPMTGLGARASLDSPTPRQMAAMYDDALDVLGRDGWAQLTMRQFRRRRDAEDAFEYRCQRDGMVGLGAGARSYTASLHYSTPWRMKSANIRAVIGDYQERMRAGDSRVSHGFRLDAGERRRRFVVQSLLFDGVDAREYSRTFGESAEAAFADTFAALREAGLVRADALSLTALGVKHADVVGEAFFSPAVRALIDAYEYDA